MLSLITRGMIFGPEIKCGDVSPCTYQEPLVTNPEDAGPQIYVDTDMSLENTTKTEPDS
ncbi:hypothetical protein KKF82_05910 [Patescibacteria group bacterium]|nr:hypothetical protein [Patescibacteria group bacterium]